jgi:hypothetical protein
MFKRFLMGIVRHSKIEKNKEENKPVDKHDLFTPAEAAFLVSKLRQAQYSGAEFEQFYQIMAKLTSLANSEK